MTFVSLTAALPAPLRHGLTLGMLSLGAAVILSASHNLTAGAIAQRAAEDKAASLAQVIPARVHDNALTETLRLLEDAVEGPVSVHLATRDGTVTAAAFELVGQGYAGPIRILIGLDPAGTVLGVRVLAHSETPGLGDKIELRFAPWIESFSGRSLTNPTQDGWAVAKDGGVFDQFSGATITPRAVVSTVWRGLELFQRQRAAILAPPPPVKASVNPTTSTGDAV